ncbi:MAG TPA: serine/threonine protein kinase [Gammaproteobacteria bacterium]|nr:serine/threonine protein kinase [Gammaproteobacteria bacterium]
MKEASLPYDALAPERVLDCVESLGLRCDGRLFALNSYENRVYQVGIEDAEPLVAKFYRPGRWTDEAILEEHAFVNELAALEIPAVAPLSFGGRTLHHHAGYRFALFPRRGGRTPDLEHPDELEWLGRFLGRLHAVGAARPFRHRPLLDAARQCEEAIATLLALGGMPDYIRPAWTVAAQELAQGIVAVFEQVGPLNRLRLHGDCHPGNLLWTDAGPHFVDFDDCLAGPAVQDVWMLLGGSREEMTFRLRHLLAGYTRFHAFDRAGLGLIEPLRGLRILGHAAWIARRWTDPAFPLAFPWFGTPRYWEEQVHTLREQLTRLTEPPLEP